jgi:hypothetical protein
MSQHSFEDDRGQPYQAKPPEDPEALAAWQARFDALLTRIRAQAPENIDPEALEREIEEELAAYALEERESGR